MKIVLYTAIFGGFDKLKLIQHRIEAPNIRYVCLTDEPQDVPGWEMVTPRQWCATPRQEARRCKALAHKYFPDADVTIWHGGNMTLRASVTQALQWLPEACHMAAIKHPDRKCIYDEAAVVILLGKDTPERVEKLMERYRNEGYPKNNGLVAASLLIRRHTKEVEEFNELWWSMIRDHSHRDQLSFNYCSWKLGLPYATIPGHLHLSPDWVWMPHR